MISTLKKLFLEYHQAQGFEIFNSFPLVADDPTVLFTNATITPFKEMFGKEARKRSNYALIQKCLRLGGAAGSLETARTNMDYASVFEMAGSGFFDWDLYAAAVYLTDLLDALGLKRECLVITVPFGTGYELALHNLGFSKDQIFVSGARSKTKHEWSFGEGDLHGCGLIIWYAKDGFCKCSAESVLNKTAGCIEIGRLVHIDGEVYNGVVQPFNYVAYDLGLGLSRIELALCGACESSLEQWRRVSQVLQSLLPDLPKGDVHYLANLCIVVNEIAAEGVVLGNKKHSYVLRKVADSFIEELWLRMGRIADLSDVRGMLAGVSLISVAAVLEGEENRLQGLHAAASRHRLKYPSMTDDELRATFGIRRDLMNLAE